MTFRYDFTIGVVSHVTLFFVYFDGMWESTCRLSKAHLLLLDFLGHSVPDFYVAVFVSSAYICDDSD